MVVQVDDTHAGQRLDVFITGQLDDFSRARVTRLIEKGCATVNGGEARPSYRIKEGDEITLAVPAPAPIELVPEDIPLDVVFEDSELLVINKPAGMVVHPGAGHESGTLVHALLHHCSDLQGIGDELRPGIVHRIDKETSGLLVVAKSQKAHTALVDQFQEHSILRQYIAICAPAPRVASGSYETLIGRHPRNRKKFSTRVRSGKRAVTHFEVLETLVKGGALVRFELETGRTHQIRVHCVEHGHPILADAVYARKAKNEYRRQAALAIGRQALHAKRLGFTHPTTNDVMEFDSELPTDFEKALVILR